ncbi:unnamed protein product [Diplocarpon coronariae]
MSQPAPATNWTVIFVLGGPGAGKGTQCARLTKHYPVCHFSIGDMMRAETLKPASPYAELIHANILEGRVGPPAMAVGMLKTAMEEKYREEGETAFIIDGFPRRIEQAPLFATTICEPAAVLFLDCAEDVQEKRLAGRRATSGRVDDAARTIPKRFNVFREMTMPVVEYYTAQNKVVQVDASKDRSAVYREVQTGLGSILKTLGMKIEDSDSDSENT